MKQKTFTAPIELKADGEPGEFIASFATLNVIDLHGDVTTPGAFDAQPVVIEPWNHDWSLPTGKGLIQADGEHAWVEGAFFLDTAAGRETYQTVKNLGPLAEWSYTFDIEESAPGEFNGAPVRFLRKLDVVGVGPVTRGAGINTRTIGIKGAGDGAGDDGAAKAAGAADTEGPEAEGQGGGNSPAAPSGVGPDVVRAQIEIIEIESGLPVGDR